MPTHSLAKHLARSLFRSFTELLSRAGCSFLWTGPARHVDPTPAWWGPNSACDQRTKRNKTQRQRASPTVIEGQLGERQLTHHAWFGYRERVHKRASSTMKSCWGAFKCRGLTTKSSDGQPHYWYQSRWFGRSLAARRVAYRLWASR